ncbi:MAG: FtsX-like permease family protein, partial [Anaerolineae bacterium]|nr:FtsX-like permease family protein [Anaerolineae bacterium]
MNTRLHLLRLLNLRHVRRGWVRALASVVGVAIGVACFVFGPALSMTISAQVGLTLNDLAGQADLEARRPDGGLPLEAVTAVRAVEGVTLAAPLVQSGVMLAGQPELLAVFGIDPALDRDMRAYRLARGDFLSGPGRVLLGDAYAAEKGLEPGAELTLVSMGGALTLRLAGTLSAESGVGRLNSGDLAVVSLEDAFRLTGKPSLDAITIRAGPGVDPGTLAAALREHLGAEALVEPPEGRFRGKETFNVAINVLMALIGTLAIVIGLMLIYNTMAISVAQRRAEIGILRALGLERGAVRSLYVAEALALGLVGSLLGAGLGLLLVSAGNSVSLMPDFTQGFEVASHEAFRVTPGLLVIAVLAGVGSALLAAQFPARQSARLDPVDAMAQVRAEAGRLRFSWRAVVVGVGLCLAMRALPFLLPTGSLEGIIAGNIGIYGVLVGMFVLVAPL